MVKQTVMVGRGQILQLDRRLYRADGYYQILSPTAPRQTALAKDVSVESCSNILSVAPDQRRASGRLRTRSPMGAIPLKKYRVGARRPC